MELFWQLSGPGSQIVRNWKGKKCGNEAIASQVYNNLAFKCENGTNGLDLILGIESSGASHILIPHSSRGSGMGLKWKKNAQPYRGSKYASLSPIRVDTDLRLQSLLEDRQKSSKITQASKDKEDNSKANGRFWNAPPTNARAAFEHGRCLWRILRNELRLQAYGLPDAQWRASLQIFSLALNFWVPNGVVTDKLLDASLTQVSLQSIRRDESMVYKTWIFIAKENQGLQNSLLAEGRVISETWDSVTLSEIDIGSQIQNILEFHSHPRETPPAPLILLVHDYHTVKDGLESLGIRTSEWKYELKELLGFDTFDRDRDRESRRHHFNATQKTMNDARHASSSRARSRSPRARTPTGLFLRESRSRSPPRTYASVYVVDVVEMLKMVNGYAHARRIRPVVAYNTLTGRSEPDDWCAGSDSRYIAESWRTMVQGPSIDEQVIFDQALSCASCPIQDDIPGSAHAESEAPEDTGLFQTQQVSADLFHDTDTDNEYP